jgi:ABC-type multidrug transport system fused ATPase/permease subunit
MAKKLIASNKEAADIARRLLREAVPPRIKLLSLSIFCMIGVAGFTAALAYSTRLIVNDVFVASDTSAALGVAALVVVVTFFKSLFTYANGVVSVVFTRSVSAAYQKRIFENVLRKDMWHFIGKHSATLMAQVKLFGTSCGTVVVNMANKLMTETLTLIALIIVMILQDPIMTLVCSVLFPVIFWLVNVLSKRIRAVAAAESQLEGAYFAVGAEAFDGIKTVKTYELESKITNRFNDAIDTLEDRILSIARVTNATVPIMEFIGGLVIGIFVVYAAWQTITHGKTPGEFTAFLTAFLMAYQPAEKITKIWVDVQKSIIHVRTMYEVLDAAPRRLGSGVETLKDVGGDISFEDVSFEYRPGHPALRNVTFNIEAGERVALVGRSGAGKSTLIDLLLRFYDPTQGTIRIGGKDLRQVGEEELYQNVALISQDVFLFDGSIRDNIRDGHSEATDAEIEEAAHRASLTDVLGDMPNGLDTSVGPNGRSLSGGQKQRVGIARALVKNAKIYIFDEATSALDGDNERAIMQTLVRELPGKTILFITHRGATLAYVSRAMLLEKGRLLAFDSVAALQGDDSRFRSLFNLGTVEDET